MERYVVNFDMKCSHDVRVKANSKVEAKFRAFVKFVRRVATSLNSYNIEVEEV